MPAGGKCVRIDKYVIHHFLYGHSVLIELSLYSDESKAGSILFWPKGYISDYSTSIDKHGCFGINLDIDRYPEIMETLRYEKPLYVGLSWNENNQLCFGTLSTSEETIDMEPVGEQEGRGMLT